MIEEAMMENEMQQGHDSSSCSCSSCHHCQQVSIPSKCINNEMSSTNILIIDDQGLILSDNMSESKEPSVTCSCCVIKNIEMVRWKDEEYCIRKDEAESLEGKSAGSGIPSQDETDVTSFEDSSAAGTQILLGGEVSFEENPSECVNGSGEILRKEEQDLVSEIDNVPKSACFLNVDSEKQLVAPSIMNPVTIVLDSGCDSITEIECSIGSGSLYGDDDVNDDDDGDSSAKSVPTQRRVHFAVQVVSEKHETPCWTPEEKATLFYTGKELHQFRLEHIIELYESQDAARVEEWSKFEGRRSLRVFWSFYAVFMDFITCKALTQYCCGGQRTMSEDTL